LITNENLDKDSFLFQNNRKMKYNSRTLQQIVKKSAKKAKIDKKISCHTLRHSFATHLLENGYSILEVQMLLGHKSPETTMIYVHFPNPKLLHIKSPLDKI